MYYAREGEEPEVRMCSADDILWRTRRFLNRPRVAYERMQKNADKYHELRARVEGVRAVRYDNPLGIRVQTSRTNHIEDQILSVTDAEHEFVQSCRLFCCERITVNNVINQVYELSPTQRKILKRRSAVNPPSYEALADEVGLKDKKQCWRIEGKAEASLGVCYVQYYY